MPTTLMIQRQPVTIFDNEQFARMLYEKLGYDASEYFRDALSGAAGNARNSCSGECDIVYATQEKYENILRDVRDVLGSWTIRRLTKDELIKRRDALYERIEGEL